MAPLHASTKNTGMRIVYKSYFVFYQWNYRNGYANLYCLPIRVFNIRNKGAMSIYITFVYKCNIPSPRQDLHDEKNLILILIILSGTRFHSD